MTSEPFGSVDLTVRYEAYFRLRSRVISFFFANITTWSDSPGILQHIEPETANVDPTLGLDAAPVFHVRRFTTANIELRDLIQSWQKRKISERFEVLAQREDNWDGYESKSPTELTLDHARYVIEELFDSTDAAGHLWLTPFISSDEDGYITAEWYKGERELHLQIEEKEAEYIQVWGTNIDTEMHVDFLHNDDYLTLWEWLLDG